MKNTVPTPTTDVYRAFTGRVRVTLAEVEAEHARPADAAPAVKAEPVMPECHLCGNTAGPWVPSGDRWPSGAQKFVCSGGCPVQTPGVEPPADEAVTRRSVDAYLSREYPALFPAAEQTEAPAGHFPWCNGHHTDVCDDGTRLTEHYGVRVSVPAPAGMDTRSEELLSAALYFSENSVVPETLLSIGGSGEGTVLDAAEADRVIGDLASFVDTLRALRAQMTVRPAVAA